MLAVIPVKSNILSLSLLPPSFIGKGLHFHSYLKETIVSAYQRRLAYSVTKPGNSRSKTSDIKRISEAVIQDDNIFFNWLNMVIKQGINLATVLSKYVLTFYLSPLVFTRQSSILAEDFSILKFPIGDPSGCLTFIYLF